MDSLAAALVVVVIIVACLGALMVRSERATRQQLEQRLRTLAEAEIRAQQAIDRAYAIGHTCAVCGDPVEAGTMRYHTGQYLHGACKAKVQE